MTTTFEHPARILPPPGYRPAPRRNGSPLLGAAAIALAVLFNLPYAILAASYDYPDILRRPAGEALDLFAAGGPALILTWHGFALAALALVPLALGLGLAHHRHSPALAIAAAFTGALAGATQAIGLWRWVFVVPHLAQAHANPGATAEVLRQTEAAFDLLNLYGGVAIGEHLGQWLTALFALLLSRAQWAAGLRTTALTGFASAAAIALGTTEGLAIALGRDGSAFAAATIAGFLLLSLWLGLTGLAHLRAPELRRR